MLYLSLSRTRETAPGAPVPGRRVAGGYELQHEVDGTQGRRARDDDEALILFEDHLPGGSLSGLGITIEGDWPGRRITVTRAMLSDRPLYYAVEPGRVVLSTSVREMQRRGFALEENPDALPELLIYRIVAPPRTLFRGISLLPGGARLDISLDGDRPTATVRNYEPPDPDEGKPSARDVTEDLLGSLRVRIRELRDAPGTVAAILSGGIDSSTMCRIAHDELGVEDVYATSYPFENPDLDVERQYALSAASALGFRMTMHDSAVSEYLESVVRGIDAAEQPLHHLQTACLDSLYRSLPEGKRLVIQGVGAGGAFGNFRNFLDYFRRPRLARGFAALPPGLLRPWASSSWRLRHALSVRHDLDHARDPDDLENPIWRFRAYGDAAWVCDHLGVREADALAARRSLVGDLWKYDLCTAWALYSLFTDEEITRNVWFRVAASAGRATLSPWYDDGILDRVLRAPWSLKMAPPENSVRKGVAELAGVPRFILDRPKTGFGVKRADWYRPGGPFEPLVRLTRGVAGDRDLQTLRAGGPAQGMTWWSLVNYAVWKRLFLGDETVDALVGELKEP